MVVGARFLSERAGLSGARLRSRVTSIGRVPRLKGGWSRTTCGASPPQIRKREIKDEDEATKIRASVRDILDRTMDGWGPHVIHALHKTVKRVTSLG